MAFTDAEPDAGQWCSRQDCVDVLHALPTYLRNDEAELNRNIARATDYAKATLRSRWPDGWPFASPTPALREVVAIRATYACFRSRALPEELDWLRAEAEAADQFLADLAAGVAELEPIPNKTALPAVGITPSPDWGQRRWGFAHAANGVRTRDN